MARSEIAERPPLTVALLATPDSTASTLFGLYDLLLNPRDQAYTVTALDALVRAAGLRIACWVAGDGSKTASRGKSDKAVAAASTP